MIARIEKFLFFLTIFFIPFQIGRHFWPKFSYVSGIRVDYLSPTIHLFDVTIAILFFLFLFSSFNERRYKHFKLARFKFVLVFTVYFLFVSFFANSVELHFFGLLSIFEAVFLGVYTSLNVKKEDLEKLIYLVSSPSIIVCIIAILEFISQRSINSVAYFLGERTFNFSTIGIAVFTIFGEKVLRPYSTFPHPNVLSFFLLFSVVISSLNFNIKKIKFRKFIILSLILSSSVIILSFSRITTLLLFVFVLYVIFNQKIKHKKVIIIGISLIFMLFLLVFSTRFLGKGLLNDFIERKNIAITTIKIIAKSPGFGTGFNNYFIYEEQIQKIITPTFLQPVHNIYLLTIVQIGVVGFLISLYFVYLALRISLSNIRASSGIKKDFYKSTLFLICGILLIGSFDHFFLTLPQGILLLSLIWGLALAKV